MRRRDVIGAVGSVLGVGLAGCVNDPEVMEADDDSETYVRKRDREDNEISGTIADEDLTFPEHRFIWVGDGHLSYVTGQVQNEGDATGDRVMVRAEYLNDAGEVVGSKESGVGDLDPGEVKTFEVGLPAGLTDEEVDDYALSARESE